MEEPAANAEPPPGLRSLLPPREFLCSRKGRLLLAEASSLNCTSWLKPPCSAHSLLEDPLGCSQPAPLLHRGTKSLVTRSTVEKYLNSRDH